MCGRPFLMKCIVADVWHLDVVCRNGNVLFSKRLIESIGDKGASPGLVSLPETQIVTALITMFCLFPLQKKICCGEREISTMHVFMRRHRI